MAQESYPPTETPLILTGRDVHQEKSLVPQVLASVAALGTMVRRTLVRRTASAPRAPMLVGAALAVAVALGLPLNFYALLHFGGLVALWYFEFLIAGDLKG